MRGNALATLCSQGTQLDHIGALVLPSRKIYFLERIHLRYCGVSFDYSLFCLGRMTSSCMRGSCQTTLPPGSVPQEEGGLIVSHPVV